MSCNPSPLLAVQSSSPTSSPTPSFTANILPIRAQAAYPVNASLRYWHPESLAPSSNAPEETSSNIASDDGLGGIDSEDIVKGREVATGSRKSEDGSSRVKVAYFRGRKLLGREIGLGDIGCRGILVSPTNTFLPPTTNPSANRSRPEESEEDNEETDEQPVQLLAEVGAFDHVVVWDHEKIPEADDLFLRGLGEEGSRWKAGMHAF